MPEEFRDRIQISSSAAAEWIAIVEAVLRGVAHALNNRGAALAAMAELTAEPAEDGGVIREILGAEQRRVRDLVQVLRTIGSAGGLGSVGGEAEAFLPAEVAAGVSLVLEQHPDLRDGAVQIDASVAAPVRVPRWAFARALIALAAGTHGATRTNPLRIVMAVDGDWLAVVARGATPAQLSPLAAELAQFMGGEPLAGPYGIRVPTLEALRRREGR